jgi:adenosyl cobinamide kinase/adenosyl cobinamide phosphate guanylyltransferase
VVSAKPGEVIFIEQELGMGIVMARNSLKRLDDVTGKYHVKGLTIGTVTKTDK